MSPTKRSCRLLRCVHARLRGHDGFTMAELLCATAILVVLGSVVVAALPTAAQVVKRATYTSNSDVLASSIDTAVSDMLRYANLYVDEAGAVQTDPATGSPLFKPSSSYVDANGSSVEKGSLQVSGGHIAIVPIVSGSPQAATPVPRSTGIYTDFTVTDFHVEFVPDPTASATHMPGVYQGSYLVESTDGSFSKQFEFACRPLATETVAG